MKRWLVLLLSFALLFNQICLAGFYSGFSGNLGGYRLAINPDTISGLRLWLKPDTGVTTDTSMSTTTVSTWANQASTGSGYDFVQATKANQPLWGTVTLNGFNGATIDNTDDFLAISAGGLGMLRNLSSYTVFIVAKMPAAAATRRALMVSTGTSGSNPRFAADVTATNRMAIQGRRLDADGNTSINTGTNNDYATDQNTYLTYLVDHNATTAKAWVNGALELNNTTYTSTGSTSDTDSMAIRIGCTIAGTNQWNGTIFEILVYNTALSDSNRQIVENYLRSKYGLSSAVILPFRRRSAYREVAA